MYNCILLLQQNVNFVMLFALLKYLFTIISELANYQCEYDVIFLIIYKKPTQSSSAYIIQYTEF